MVGQVGVVGGAVDARTTSSIGGSPAVARGVPGSSIAWTSRRSPTAV
ncbi:hypothetical protein [Catenulispora subtropica]